MMALIAKVKPAHELCFILESDEKDPQLGIKAFNGVTLDTIQTYKNNNSLNNYIRILNGDKRGPVGKCVMSLLHEVYQILKAEALGQLQVGSISNTIQFKKQGRMRMVTPFTLNDYLTGLETDLSGFTRYQKHLSSKVSSVF